MANGSTHKLIAASVIGTGLTLLDIHRGQLTLKPVFGAALATLTANLPDLLEPPTSSHHRQFYHSIAFASAITLAIERLHDWQPITEYEKAWRLALLVICNTYLIHLGLDFVTPRSLPLVGKL